MISSKLSSILFFLLFLAVAFFLEFIRRNYQIPVTILDVLLFPLAILITGYSLKNLIFKRKQKLSNYPTDDSKLKLVFSLFFCLIVMIPLGLYTAWMGIQEPFEYFSGVKGSAHGYTLVPVGALIAGLGVFVVFKIIQNLIPNTKI